MVLIKTLFFRQTNAAQPIRIKDQNYPFYNTKYSVIYLFIFFEDLWCWWLLKCVITVLWKGSIGCIVSRAALLKSLDSGPDPDPEGIQSGPASIFYFKSTNYISYFDKHIILLFWQAKEQILFQWFCFQCGKAWKTSPVKRWERYFKKVISYSY